MLYRKLKRTWSHNSIHYIPGFRKAFPELSKVDDEEMANRFADLGIDFYTEEKAPVPLMMRLTLPIALILFVLMLIWLPIQFIITGKWGYALKKENKILNWFKALKLQ